MSGDLEEQLNEMGPAYRKVVDRLRRARTADGRRRAPALAWLLAASVLAVVSLGVLFRPRPPSSARPFPREYVMTVPEMIASQNADGSWKNDFLTRRNAEALRLCADGAARIAYKKAVRNLRAKGLL